MNLGFISCTNIDCVRLEARVFSLLDGEPAQDPKQGLNTGWELTAVACTTWEYVVGQQMAGGALTLANLACPCLPQAHEVGQSARAAANHVADGISGKQGSSPSDSPWASLPWSPFTIGFCVRFGLFILHTVTCTAALFSCAACCTTTTYCPCVAPCAAPLAAPRTDSYTAPTQPPPCCSPLTPSLSPALSLTLPRLMLLVLPYPNAPALTLAPPLDYCLRTACRSLCRPLHYP